MKLFPFPRAIHGIRCGLVGLWNSPLLPVNNLPPAAVGPGDQVLGRKSLVLLTYCLPLLDLDTSHGLPHVHISVRRVRSDLQRSVLRGQVPRPHQPLLGDAGQPRGPRPVPRAPADWRPLRHSQVRPARALSNSPHSLTPDCAPESSSTHFIHHSSFWL